MRYTYLFFLTACLCGCRDVQIIDSSQGGSGGGVNGYRLAGTTTTGSGLRIDSASVVFSYGLEQYDTTPIDTQRVVVKDSLRLVRVVVNDANGSFVRFLSGGYFSPGVVPRARWDNLDQFGKMVPTGKYIVRYIIDTTVVKDEQRLVQTGQTVTVSDAQGQFTIDSDRLPVGEYFDLYSGDTLYVETVRVRPTIYVEVSRFGLTSAKAVTLLKNAVTNEVFILK